MNKCHGFIIFSIYTCLTLLTTPGQMFAQAPSDYDRQRGQMMLDQVKRDIEENYYDRNYHKVDLDQVFKTAASKLKLAQTNGQIMGIIAQATLELNDSHTAFAPPGRKAITDYGFELQMIGESAFITRVKEKSNAAEIGLKVGDTVYLVDGYQPARQNVWKLIYLYYVLRPQPAVKLTIASPGGEPRELIVMSKVTDQKHLDLTNFADIFDLEREAENEERERKKSHRIEVIDDVTIWKMPRFDLSEEEVDSLMKKAAKSKALILDLRGNPGGYELTLLRLIGNLFERDIKIGEIQRRKESKPFQAKTVGRDAFKGNLIVIVDSRSASSSEILARTVQLEKRGTIIGDQSAGAVMRSRFHSHLVGISSAALYGVSVTDANITMSDGGVLEGVGVRPDEIVIPTGEDLAAKRDPVLSRAAKLAGITLEPEKAGEIFREVKKP